MHITIFCGLNINLINFKKENTAKPFISGTSLVVNENDILVEFPETHLHSRALTKKLVELIVTTKAENKNLNIVTHNDTVLNFIAYHIHKGQTDSSNFCTDVDIEIYGVNEENSEFKFVATLNEQGFFENWHYGFLDYSPCEFANCSDC